MDSSKKKQHRSHVSKAEDDTRHETIARLWVKGYSALEIHSSLQGDFPNLTLQIVQDHITEIKKQAASYIVLRYLPEVGEHFFKAHQNLQESQAEAWNMYYSGIEKTETTNFMEEQNGQLVLKSQIKRVTKYSRQPSMLALVSHIAVAEMSITDMAPVVKRVQSIIDENRRLVKGEKVVSQIS